MTPILAATYILLWILVLFQAALLLGLTRMVVGRQETAAPILDAPVLPARHLQMGSEAPSFTVDEALGSGTISSSQFSGHRTLLAFVRAGCPQCVEALELMRSMATNVAEKFVIVVHGDREDAEEFARLLDPPAPTIVDNYGAISDSFGIEHTPRVVLLDEHWLVLKYGYPGAANDIVLVESYDPKAHSLGHPNATV